LFDEIAPAVLERQGGYTRVIKLGQRRGDGAEEAIIQLVDWSAKQDGVVSLNDKKRKPATRKAAPKAAAKADVVADTATVSAATAAAETVSEEVSEAAASEEQAPAFEDSTTADTPTATEVEGGGETSDDSTASGESSTDTE
jgi:large subunit ribosomal protein L17